MKKTNHEILSSMPVEKVAEAMTYLFAKIISKRFPEEEYSNFEMGEDEELIIKWLSLECKE